MAWDIRLRMPLRARLSTGLCLLAIWWMRLLGYRLIWTVHNVLPHEPQTHDDLRIVQTLAQACSAVIVHSSTVIASLADMGIASEKAVVIAQGSYIGHYGAPPEKVQARKDLGLSTPGRIVLFFGLIRPYKGVIELLHTWSNSPSNGILVIAGFCPDPELQTAIQDLSAGDPSIVLRLSFVPDAQVSTYFAACDCVCLPFLALTTSSSALLALSFAKPIIAPRLGALQDLPESVGYFYSPDGPDGLNNALSEFFEEDDDSLNLRSASGLRYAMNCSWPLIAERTFELYRSVAADSQQVGNRSQ